MSSFIQLIQVLLLALTVPTQNARNREMYYDQHGNTYSVYDMFSGYIENISMQEIYGIDYNSSIYHFTTIIQTGNLGAKTTTTTIEVTMQNIVGLDGSFHSPSRLLGLSFLSASYELCATFFFLSDIAVKKYDLGLAFYSEMSNEVFMSGFMSLPNQARSFDKFQLFEFYKLPDSKKIVMDFSVTSLKFLQKRNTVADPCIHVDNYDKVSLTPFLPLKLKP
jgi:hypothetical protein